eukprot:350084-Chlamydomonas_euryale.AAC.3
MAGRQLDTSSHLFTICHAVTSCTVSAWRADRAIPCVTLLPHSITTPASAFCSAASGRACLGTGPPPRLP